MLVLFYAPGEDDPRQNRTQKRETKHRLGRLHRATQTPAFSGVGTTPVLPSRGITRNSKAWASPRAASRHACKTICPDQQLLAGPCKACGPCKTRDVRGTDCGSTAVTSAPEPPFLRSCLRVRFLVTFRTRPRSTTLKNKLKHLQSVNVFALLTTNTPCNSKSQSRKGNFLPNSSDFVSLGLLHVVR